MKSPDGEPFEVSPETGGNPSARRHFLTYLVGKAASVFAQVMIVIVVSRLLGSTTYLDYSLVLASSIFATNIGMGWSRQAMLRDADQGAGRLATFPPVGSAIGILASATLATLMSRSIIGLSPWECAAAAAFSLGYALNYHAVTVAQHELRAVVAGVLESARLLITALLPLVAAAAWSLDFAGLLLCGALANLAPGFVSLTRRTLRRRSARADLTFGLPMALWLGVSTVLQFSDRYIVEVKIGEVVAAGYATTYDLVARGVGAVMLPLIQALHPLIMAAANRGDVDRVNDLLRKGGRLSIALLALLSLTAAFLGQRLLPLVSTLALTDMTVLVALAVSGAGWQFALLWHKPLEIARRTKPLLISLALATCVNVALNWLFASSLGVRFVAINNLTALVIYLVLVKYLRRGDVSQRQGSEAL